MEMTYSAKIKVLSSAINFRNPVVITYKNEEKSRLINPYAVYDSTKGNSTLDAFQVSGQTNSEIEKFKCFLVEEIKSIAVASNQLFSINEKYNPKSDRYTNAFLKIKS